MDITINRQPSAAPQATGSLARTRAAVITGRIVSGLVVALLTLDSIGKLLRVPQVIEGTTQLGYTAEAVVPLGVTLLLCVLVYAMPATSVLGAVLLTAYLGGAVATHVRVGSPPFTHVLVPVYLRVALWLGLALRDPRLGALLPGRRHA